MVRVYLDFKFGNFGYVVVDFSGCEFGFFLLNIWIVVYYLGGVLVGGLFYMMGDVVRLVFLLKFF